MTARPRKRPPNRPAVLWALNEALRAQQPRPEDAAVVALAKGYAALIDEAMPTSVYARHLRAIAAALDPDDEAAAESFIKVTDALSAHSVASDLGPKLLAALDSLRLTPKARAAVLRGGVPDDGKSRLDVLREQRRARADRAAAVDPAPS